MRLIHDRHIRTKSTHETDDGWAEDFWIERLAFHFDRPNTAKAAEALGLPGTAFVPPPPAFLITVDNIPDDISSTVTLTVGGPSIVSTLDTIGDQDFFRVELEAGKTYEFGQYLVIGGPSGIPLADAYLELYDAAGNLLVSADGGGPNTPSGLDALLSYTPTASGTYYVNARSYDENPLNGTTGDFIGDYEIFAREASPFAYRPYYDPDSPLYALDWGSQVDGTSRNPDGDEGPRPTGNAHTGYAWNPYGIEGKSVIKYYFAKQGEIFVSEDPANPGLTENIVAAGMADWEKSAFTYAFGEFEKVADLVYIEVENRYDADFTLITYSGTPGPGVSLLGRMSPPNESNEGQAEFNSGDERWNEAGLAPGGFTFVTLIHELGHGHGMAHPHDGGGRSGVMRGVEPDGVAFSYTLGDFDLNQGVYTMMSYEDGWQTSPYGQAATNAGYGWLGGLMAFDIAVIQDKYGVNEDTNTGNDLYVLKDENAPGTFYYSIWDAGGNDTIAYYGARDAVIDLRPATLQYEHGGGGWMSYAFGIHGGFTIANGVTIENAIGGAGNDRLTGNDAANVLNGGGGADVMTGFGGDDVYLVDDADDQVIELAGEGNDTVYAYVGYTLASGTSVETLSTFNHQGTEAIDLTGNGIANTLYGNAGANVLNGGGGADVMWGFGGDDTYIIDHAGDQIREAAGQGYDTAFTYVSYTLGAGVSVEVLSTFNHHGTEAINLTGNALANRLFGNAGDNVLDGGAGADVLTGFGGADTFAFTTALGAANVDRITDFQTGIDKIALDDAIFTALGGLGALNPNAFVTGTAATSAAQRIVYDQATGQLFYDADGNGAGAAILFATLDGAPNLAASDFVVI